MDIIMDLLYSNIKLTVKNLLKTPHRSNKERGFMGMRKCSFLAKICNQDNLQISFGYSKHKNPNSIQEMGLVIQPLAPSTGFVDGLNVGSLISVSDSIFRCQTNCSPAAVVDMTGSILIES